MTTPIEGKPFTNGQYDEFCQCVSSSRQKIVQGLMSGIHPVFTSNELAVMAGVLEGMEEQIETVKGAGDIPCG